MISRRLDEDTGVIYVTSTGLPSQADTDTHYNALRTMIEPIRRAQKRVLLLTDVRNAEHTTPEHEQHILDQMGRTFLPGDRVVALTREGDKNYIRQLFSGVEIGAFSSQLAAEMWLMTENLPKIP